jgi:hypothetical protein
MTKQSVVKTILLFLLMLCFPVRGLIFAEKIALKIIANHGAVLRSEPSLSARSLTKLQYGAFVFLIKDTKIDATIKLDDMNYQGSWLEVTADKQKGFIFSALVEDNALNSFTCAAPKEPYDLYLGLRDVDMEICKDGTYVLNNAYGCYGTCTEHGCWQMKNAKLHIVPQKSFAVDGIGQPISCTHFCTYHVYKVRSVSVNNPTPKPAPGDLAEFGKKLYTNGSADPVISERRRQFGCRDSLLFRSP